MTTLCLTKLGWMLIGMAIMTHKVNKEHSETELRLKPALVKA